MAKIILTITGSVAAYKGIELYKMLKKEHQVELILSKGALHFLQVPPKEAKTEIFTHDYYSKSDSSEHIKISENADLFITYPATQNFIAQIANGLTNNLESLVYSAMQGYKMIFPAMNTGMYLSAANLRNIKQLEQDGTKVFTPRSGLLACNTVGIGRAWEWQDVLTEINNFLIWKNKLVGKNVMLNFGRTKTYLDDIRYLTNNSSGKMGDALHTVLSWTNCNLTMIVGDCDFPIYYNHIKATTNQEMLAKMQENFSKQDIFIAAAALNDYQVAEPITGKIKKRDHPTLAVNLTSNIDVLASLGKVKQNQILVGFSAQDDFDLEYGKRKLLEKNLDLIIINKTTAMGSEQNAIILVTKDASKEIPSQDKINIAMIIITTILEVLEKRLK